MSHTVIVITSILILLNIYFIDIEVKRHCILWHIDIVYTVFLIVLSICDIVIWKSIKLTPTKKTN